MNFCSIYVCAALLAAAMACAPSLFCAEEAVDQERVANYGQDFTRPLNRVDLRLEAQQGMNCSASRDLIATARTDLLIRLSGGWRVGVRCDVPYAWYWKGADRQACGSDVTHWDDSLLQVLLIAPPCCKWTVGGGVKAIFPTAGDNLEIGDGKYQLLPTMGVRYDLGDWSDGSYVGAIVRYAFDVAGYRSAPYISKVYVQPLFNLNLPDKWFINSSPEMIYNWRIKKWFIPFDLMVGKMVTENVVVSLEYECALVYRYKQFTQEMELRVGYFY